MNLTTKRSIALIIGLTALGVAVVQLILNVANSREKQADTWTRFLLTFADTNTGIIEVANGQSTIYYASPNASSILGYNDRELEGVDLSAILPPDMAPHHQLQMYYAMGLASSSKLKTKVTAMLCKARRYDGTEVEVVIRLFIGKHSVFALINRADETKYLPPREPATDFNAIKEK